MGHTESSLMKLNKEDSVRLLLDYQGKFKSVLDDLKNKSDELKTIFTRLEADLNISKNVNSKLSERLINVERKSFANKQYCRRECLQILGIPPVLLGKEKLENLDAKRVNLPSGTKIYINESLCTYYKKLWSKCKSYGMENIYYSCG